MIFCSLYFMHKLINFFEKAVAWKSISVFCIIYCVSKKKWVLMNGMPSHKLCFDKDCYIQTI